MRQLDALTLPVLVSRLVGARHHLLAYRVAEMVGSGADAVAAHWWAAVSVCLCRLGTGY